MYNKDKIILDLCGGTGSWARPYKEAGYTVMTLTLPDNDVSNWTKGDMPDVAYLIQEKKIYGILAAPPCTQFSFAKTTGQPRDFKEGMRIVNACLKIVWECQYDLISPYAKTTNLKFWALENPNGLLKRFLGKPVFEFDPYDFGDSYQKKTHLWGWFNDPVKTSEGNKDKFVKFDKLKTKEIHPEFYGKLTRNVRRSITPAGFAQAFYEVNK